MSGSNEMRPSRLGALGVEFPFLVAPMVGLSHVAFRELVRIYTPPSVRPLIFTEMLSSRRLPSERLDSAESLFCAEGENHFVPQLLGNEERFIAPSIKKLMELNPWGIDVNMGCPVKKTLQHNWGVRLLGDKQYAGEVVRITKANSSIPVSVKLRAGIGTAVDEDYLFQFTDELEKAGADWLTVHCRASGMKHRGPARWDAVSNLRKRRSIPVVGNGDVQTADEALATYRDFAVDGVMLARAVTARPWIIAQIAERLGLAEVSAPQTPEEEGREYFQAVLKFIFLVEKYFGESALSLQKVKFYVAISHRWLPFGHHFWSSVHRTKSLAEATRWVENYAAENPQSMNGRVVL